jgi:hypothetical protein
LLVTASEGGEGSRLCCVTGVAADATLLRADATTQRHSMETLMLLAADAVFVIKADDQLILAASRCVLLVPGGG